MIYLDIYLDILPIFGGTIFQTNPYLGSPTFRCSNFCFRWEAATALDTPHTLVVSCFLPATPHEMGRGISDPLAIARRFTGASQALLGTGFNTYPL